MKQDLYTIQEVSSILGVSTKTLRRWEEGGIIKPIRTAGNQRRYRLEDVRRLERRRNLQKVKQEVKQEMTPAIFPQTLPEQSSPVAASIVPQTVKQAQDEMIKHQPNFQRFIAPTMGMAASIIFLLGGALVWQLSGYQGLHTSKNKLITQHEAGAKQSVLAANTAQPAFQLNVNIPSFFGKKVTFLDAVAIKKGLSVTGLSQLNGGITTNNANINAGKGKLTASNVLYSVLAGSNITITGDKQNPTISADLTAGVSSLQGTTGDVTLAQGDGIGLNGLTINNTGVLSLQGENGDVTLTPGDGIDISGTTITNTDTGSAQNIFKTITAGGTDIVAGSNNDQVTFAAGSGISVTGDAGTNTITIAGTGGSGSLSGLTTNGVLYATDATDAGSTPAGTNGTVLHGVTGGAPIFSAVDLTADVANILPLANGGTGIGTIPTNGEILIGNGAGYQLATITQGSGIGISNGSGSISIANNGVLSLTGTADEVLVNGGTSVQTGAITLTLPQGIGTSSTPTFASATLSSNTNELTLGTGDTGVLSLETLTGNRTYTLPDASGEICLTSGNCSGTGGALTGSGDSNYIPKFTSSSGIGDSDIYDNGKIGIGTVSPQGLFSVSGTSPGFALAELNQTGSGDILTGSSSGTPRFVFDSNGDLNIIGGSYQIGGTNVLSGTTLGSTVVNSSLTSVGIVNGGSITSGFGSILTTNTIQGTDFTASGTTGYSSTGNGAGLLFSGTGNHSISASSGTLELGGTTLIGAVTGNNQSVTGLNNLSAAGTITLGSLITNNGLLYTNGSGVVGQSNAGTDGQVLLSNSGTPTFTSLSGDVASVTGAGLVTLKSVGPGAGSLGTTAAQTPVITVDAQGRIVSVSNTSIAIAASQITSGQVAIANGGTNGSATPTAGGIAYGTGSAYGFSAAGSSGQVLESGGTGAPTWVSAGTIGTNYWQEISGSLSPLNITDDLLLGSTATNSAKFAFTGVAGGTPTASISANSGNNDTYLTGDGTLATTNKQSLTLGSASTGNITIFGIGTGVVQANSGIISTGLVQNNELQNNSITINTSTGLSGGGAVALGNALTLTNTGVTSALAGTGISVSGPTGAVTITNSGVTSLTGTTDQILVNGGTSAQTGGITLTLPQNIDSTASPTFTSLTLSSFTSNGGPLYTNGSGVLAQVTAGSSHQVLHGGATPSFGAVDLTAEVTGILPLANGGTNANLTANNGGIVYSGSSSLAILAANANPGLALISGGAGSPSWFAPTQGSLVFAGPNGALSQNNPQLFFDNTKDLLGLGTATPVAKLDVEGAVAGKALSIFNYTGTDQNILVASTSGTEEFAINNTGSIQFTGGSSFLQTLTSNATHADTYNFPDIGGASADICLTTGNCAGVGGSITGTGTSGRLAKFTGTGAIGNGSINDLFTGVALTIDANGNLGIGTTTPKAALAVNGAYGSNAAAIINQLNSGDLLTASASGATEFTIANNGSLEFTGASGFLQTLTASATAGKTYNFPDFAGTNADICLSTGNCAGSGSGVTGSGIAGQLAFFSGASSVTSDSTLFFDNTNKLFGIGTGTPVGKLDVEGAVTGKALTILNTTGDQAIFTASASGTTRFTIGNDGTLTATKYTTNGGLLYTNASGIVAQSNAGTDGQVLLSNSGTPMFTSLSGDVASVTGAGLVTLKSVGPGAGSLGTTGAQTPVITIDAQGRIVSVSNTSIAIAASQITSGQLSSANGGTGADLSGASQYSIPYFSASGVLGGALAPGIGGYVLTTNGGSGAPTWTNAASLGTNYFQLNSGALSPALITNDLLLGGTSTTSAKFAFENMAGGTPTASISGNLSLAVPTGANPATTLSIFNGGTFSIQNSAGGDAGLTSRLFIQPNGNVDLSSTASSPNKLYVSGNIDIGSAYSATAAPSNGMIVQGNVGIGTKSPLATLDVRVNSATIPVASISGSTNMAGLVVDQSGSGDIFTASASGLTKFTILNNGNVQINNLGTGVVQSSSTGLLSSSALNLAGSNVTGILPVANGGTGENFSAIGQGVIPYFSSTGVMGTIAAGTSSQCLLGGTTPSWGSCALGTNYWQENSGALSPANITDDLLLGGTSTASAKFAVLNMAGGTPVASVAGNFIVMPTIIGGNQVGGDVGIGTTNPTGLLTIQGTTANGTLQISNGTNSMGIGFTATGNVSAIVGTISNSALGFRTNNINRMTIQPGGSIGIGTSNPTALLDVDGAASVSGQLDLYGTPQIQSTANQILTIGGNTTGDIAFQPGGTSVGSSLYLQSGGNVGIGTATPLATLDLRGNSGTTPVASLSGKTSFAGLVVDNSGSGDIFTASASGATRLTLTNSGSLKLVGGQTSDLDTLSGTTLAIGASTATTLTLGRSGQSIDIPGYSSAGGILYSNSGVLAMTGTGTSSQCLLGGATPTWGSCALGTNYWQLNNGAVSPFNITNDLLLGGTATTSAKFAFINNIGSGTPTASISAGTANNNTYLTGAGVLGTTDAQTLQLGAAGTGNVSLAPNGTAVLIASTSSVLIPFNGSGSTTAFQVLTNSSQLLTVDTVNTRVTIGTTGGCTTTYGTGRMCVQNGAPGSGGTTNFNSTTAITGTGGTSTGNAIFLNDTSGSTGNTLQDLVLDDTNTTNASSIADSIIAKVNANQLNLGNFIQFQTGGTTKFQVSNNGTVGIGIGSATPLATLDVRANSATTPVGSVSGASNFANFVVDQSGSGDIFTASASGATRLTLTNGGTLKLVGGQTSDLDTLTGTTLNIGATNATTISLGRSGQSIALANYNNCGALTTVGTTLTCSGTPAGTNFWQLNSGAVSPLNITNDLLLGGTSTTSAKFAFINNIGAGTPTASISANSGNNATYLTGAGTLGTTNGQTLTIGSASTGNINFTTNGNSLLTLQTFNNIGNPEPELFATGSEANGTPIDLGNANGYIRILPYGVGNTTYYQSSQANMTYSGLNGGQNTLLSFDYNGTDFNGQVGIGDTPGANDGALSIVANDVPATGATGDLELGYSSTNNYGWIQTWNNNPLALNPAANINGVGIGTSAVGNGELVVNQQYGGNIFSASQSGTTKFLISNSGNVTISNFGTGVIQSNGSGLLSSSALNLAGSNVTGILPVANGGTGENFSAIGQGVIPYFSSTGVMGTIAAGTSSQCLLGGTTPSWGSCALGSNYWQENSGALSPANITDDLLLGGTSTTSARFAFINNIGSGTPTASISANSGNNATYLTGAGVLGTTNAQTLTLGSASTGDIAFQPGGKSVGTSLYLASSGNVGIGTTSPTASLSIVGATSDSSTNSLSVANSEGVSLINVRNDGTVGLGTQALGYSVVGQLTDTNNNGNVALSKFTTGSSTSSVVSMSIYVGDPDSTNKSYKLAVYTNTGSGVSARPNTLFANSGTGTLVTGWNTISVSANLSANTTYWLGYFSNTASISTDNEQYDPSITNEYCFETGQTFPTLPSTFSASGCVNAIMSIYATTSNPSALQINSVGNVGIGTTAPDAPLTVNGDGTSIFSGTANTVADFYGNGSEAVSIFQGSSLNYSGFVVGNSSDKKVSLNAGSNGSAFEFDSSGYFAIGAATNANVGLGQSNDLFYLNPSGQFGLGINNTSPLATLDLRAVLGTLPVASISGKTSFASLVVDNSGSGDIFTASASGATRLTLTNGGTLKLVGGQTSDIDTITGTSLKIGATNATSLALGNASAVTTAVGGLTVASGKSLTLTGLTANNQVLYANTSGVVTSVGTTSTANQCLLSGTSTPSWGSCDLGTTSWVQANGTIYPGNSTEDLLLGGTATTSADFAFTGVDTSTPIASISAINHSGNGNGLVLNASTSTIQSLMNNTLTIGGNTTGSISFQPGGVSAGAGLYLASNGSNAVVGIGTTQPGQQLSVYYGANIDQGGSNNGFLDQNGSQGSGLSFGSNSSGEGIASKRTSGGNQYGLDFYTNYIDRMSITQAGLIGIGTTSPLASLDVRANSGTLSVASVSGKTSFASLVVDQSGSGDIFTASSSGLPRFTITQNGNVGIGVAEQNINSATEPFNSNSAGLGNLIAAGAIQVGDTTTAGVGSVVLTAKSGASGLVGFYNGSNNVGQLWNNGTALDLGQNNSSYIELDGGFNGTGQGGIIGIDTPSTPLATLDVRANNLTGGTLSVASISGKTSFAGLVVDNSGSGDLFTASSAGLTKFTVQNNGNILLGANGLASANPVTISGAQTAGSNEVGGSLTLAASNGTGIGGSGSLNFQVANASAASPTFDSEVTASQSNDSAHTLSWNHTINDNGNRLLVVGVAVDDNGVSGASKTVSSITYAGQSLTKLSSLTYSTSSREDNELWYLVNPPQGTAAVTVTISGTANIEAGSADYYNVNQTTPFGTPATNSGNSATGSVTVSSGSNQLVIDHLAADDNTQFIGGAGNQIGQQIELWNDSSLATPQDASSYRPSAGSTTAMTWGLSTTFHWSDIGVALQPITATNADGYKNALTITSNGNVGIGTATPSANLSVVGSIQNLANNSVNPTQIASTSAGLVSPQSVAIQGKYAYIGDSAGALVIYDISNPASPVKVGSLSSGIGFPQSVVVQGRYVYMVDASGFRIIDVSNPAVPVLVGTTNNGLSDPLGVFVSGRYAYVVDWTNNALVIFDISNPANPIDVGSTTSGLGNPNSVYVQGRYAYVTNWSGQLSIFDVSNPASPIPAGSVDNGSESGQVVVQGRYAYVADFQQGLIIYDVSNPTSPTYVTRTMTGLATPGDLAVTGRYAYVTDQYNDTLNVFDVSTPATPTWVGSSNLNTGFNEPVGVTVSGINAYVTTDNSSGSNGSLQVFNLGGGILTQALEAESGEVGQLNVDGSETIGNQLSVGGGLNVGAGGIYSAGAIAGGNLNINGLTGTTPIASISGKTSFAGLVVDQSGSGNIFTASASGATKFTISNTGIISDYGSGDGLNLYSHDGSGGYAGLYSATNGQLTFYNGAITDTISSLGKLYLGNGNASNNMLDVSGGAAIGSYGAADTAAPSNGLIVSGNVGIGTATPLATLDVRGNSGTTPVASISGKTTFAAAVVDQSGSGDIFTASKSGATKFTIQNSGTVVIGNSTNGITFDPTGATVGIYSGTARPTRQIVLSAEYAGAVLTASDSANTGFHNGFMTSDASPSANFENYYQWTSTQTGQIQDYTVAVRVTLPKDFSGWATSGNAMSVDLNTNITDTASDKLNVYVYNPTFSASTPVLYDQSQTSSSNNTWTTRGYTSAQLSNWATAGQTAVIYLRMFAQNGMFVQVGDIKLNYLSSF